MGGVRKNIWVESEESSVMVYDFKNWSEDTFKHYGNIVYFDLAHMFPLIHFLTINVLLKYCYVPLEWRDIFGGWLDPPKRIHVMWLPLTLTKEEANI